MKLLSGLLVIALLSVEFVTSIQDVDGTIVWVNNDKKEKELVVGKSNTAEKEDLGYWNLADSRISDIDVVDEGHGKKHKPTAPRYVGDEDTPSLSDKRRPPGPSNNRDTVDAEVISDEESDNVDDDSLTGDSNDEIEDKNYGDSHSVSEDSNLSSDSYDEEESDNGDHDGKIVTDEATSIVEGASQKIGLDTEGGADENASVLSEVGQGKSRVEKPKKKSRRKKNSHRMVSKKRSSKKRKSHRKISKKNTQPSLIDSRSDVRGDVKSVVDIKGEDDREENSLEAEIDKAKTMLYDGTNIKRDDISKIEPLEYQEGNGRDKMGSYAPDDGDISNIVSHFTDHKQDNFHRMGNDELQMHLDDEALKMQVKAIEEEDSNVKNVLQGSERFANEQKLGHFEGDFEKDLIKNIGKDGVDLDIGEFGKHKHERHHGSKSFVEVEDKSKDEDGEKDDENEKENYKERFETRDKEDEGVNEEDEGTRSRDSRDKKFVDNDRNEDDDDDSDDDEEEDDGRHKNESGERKDIVRSSSEEVKHKKNHRSAKKYKFFTPTGKFGGDVSPSEEAEMGVNIDNQTMESEIKEIENEDAKVSSALEGINNTPDKIELDEYKYDSADGQSAAKFNHHIFGTALAYNNDDIDNGNDQADQKHVVGQTEDLKGGSHISDDLRDMLLQTSKILNETNAVLNEGHAVVQNSHEILNSTNTHKGSIQNDSTPTPTNGTAGNETNTNEQMSSKGFGSKNTSSSSGVSTGYSQSNSSNVTDTTPQHLAANENNTHDNVANTSSGNESSRSSSFATSKEEFFGKGVPTVASKRVLKRNDDYELRTAHEMRKRPSKSSWRRSDKSHRRHRKEKLKSFFNDAKENPNRLPKNNYTKKEFKILKLMYKSPIVKGVHGKVSKFHLQQADKRSYTPNKKMTYRRYKKPKTSHKKGMFTKKRISEMARRRGDVEEGMTGAISYTNRDGNEFMFAVSTQTLTWGESNAKCRSLGGELLSIGDREEQEFIQANVIPEKSHYWIGFTDQESEGTWQWTDRTPVRYSNWSNLEPDDGNIKSGQTMHNEDCAVINPTMDWSDVPCWNRFHFICKFLPDNGRAISFGGTLSYSDVGNKKYDEFAQGLKSNKKLTKPIVGSTKPVIEGPSNTRQKANGLMTKGYSGQGPSRGGDKLSESTMNTGKANNLVAGTKGNSAGMVKGKEAGVKGGAAAAALNSPSAKGASVMDAGRNGLKQITSALNEAAKAVGTASKNVKNAGDAALTPAKAGPGPTGLGSIPGITGAGITGNPSLGKIGGVEALGGGAGSVQKGGNGNQSPIAMKPGNNSPQSSQSASSVAGGGGSSGKFMSAGANAGAAGHVATGGGLAQATGNSGASAGGGGGAQAGGAASVGGPAGGAVGGSAAPTGGVSGSVPSGSVGVEAPAVSQASSSMSGASSAGGAGGGGQQLTPEQAAAAKQLANQLAPQLARAYSRKFEPDMQMIQVLCGKFCGNTVMSLQHSNPQQLGEACGRVCAESLLKGSPQDVMNMMSNLVGDGPPQSSNIVTGGANTQFSNKLPVGSIGGNMQQGDNQPNGALGGVGGSNGGGPSSGSSEGSSGSSNSGGGGGGSSGGVSSGGSSSGGGSSGGSSSGSSSSGGGGSDGNPINLNTLGSILAPILGLNIDGGSKISPSEGQTLGTKVSEAIDSLKKQYNLKTNTASKSSTPGRVMETGVEEQEERGYFLLKKMKGSEDIAQKSKEETPVLSLKKSSTREPSLKNKTEVSTSEGYLKSEGEPSSIGYVTGSKREMKIGLGRKSSKGMKSRKTGKHRKHLGKMVKRKHKRKYRKTN